VLRALEQVERMYKGRILGPALIQLATDASQVSPEKRKVLHVLLSDAAEVPVSKLDPILRLA
jgi:hypothetical protein